MGSPESRQDVDPAKVDERLRQLVGWREILLGDDEDAKRVLIESLQGNDLVVALTTLDDLTDDELRAIARFRP